MKGVATALLGMIAATNLVWGASAPQTQGAPVRPAPRFSVVDLSGARVSNASFKSKTTVLFVFCGCRECRLVAEEWARRSPSARPGVQTLVSYSGEADEVKRMAKAWPGREQAARFLVDPHFTIAEGFRALPCPAAFVIDGKQRLRYSSKETAGELETDPKLIIGQVFDALKDVRSGRKVVVSSDTNSDVSPLSAMESRGSERRDDSTLYHLILAKPSQEEATEERVFSFQNTTHKPIHVDQVVSSCGCNEAGLLVNGDVVPSAVIKPGQLATLRVRLRVAPNYSGQKSVQVWLMAKDVRKPLGNVQIELRGN